MSVLCAAFVVFTALTLAAASGLQVDLLSVGTWVWVVVYSVSQLAAHELAHVGALRFFGRRPDRVGFRLNYWVFPAFYVRMNDTHLLARSEKIVVHSAGLFVNAVSGTVAVGAAYAFGWGDSAMFAFAWYGVTMIINAVPILKSDGYRVLLAVCGVSERQRWRDNPRGVRVVGVISAAVALAYASWLMTRLLGMWL